MKKANVTGGSMRASDMYEQEGSTRDKKYEGMSRLSQKDA
jgi:hypothetical protein